MPTRALCEHVAELVLSAEAAGYVVRAVGTIRLRVGAEVKTPAPARALARARTDTSVSGCSACLSARLSTCAHRQQRVCVQEYTPTLFCLAPDTPKRRDSVVVREVRAYGRAEMPHVHLRAADGADAGSVFPLAVGIHERAAVVAGWRRQAEAVLERSCLLCHGAEEAGHGHVCGAWVRVQVPAPPEDGPQPHTDTGAHLHEQLAYAELSGLATAGAGALPELELLVCVAGEQQVLAGMLNAVALAACLCTPENLAPEFPVPAAGATLLSLHACVEHYAGVLRLDADARAALQMHSTRVALHQQPVLRLQAEPREVLACWRALLAHRLWSVPSGEPRAGNSAAYAVRAVRHATGQAIAPAALTHMLATPESPALPAWPEAFFARLRELFAHEFGVWSRAAHGAPRIHDALGGVAQRQRRDFLFLQYLLHTLGPPVVGQQRVAAAVVCAR